MTQVFRRRDDGFGDSRFVSFLGMASEHGGQWFTRPQLYGAYVRRQARNPWRSAAVTLVISAIAGVVVVFVVTGHMFSAGLWLAISAAVLLAVWQWRRARSGAGLKKFVDFNRDFDRWIERHGRPEKLLDKPGLGEPPDAHAEPDLYDYGVERLIIVDRDLLVDLFVLNGLASDWRALIISSTGYPDYLMPRVAQLFAAQPKLPVYLLHDSGPVGEAMFDKLLDHEVLQLRTRDVIDAGLHRDDHPQWPLTRRMSRKFGRRIPLDALPLGMLGFIAPFAFADASTLAEAQVRHGSTGASGDFG